MDEETRKIAHRKATAKYQKTIKGKINQKRHRKTKKGKVNNRAKQKCFRMRHPNQEKAKHAVNNAIQAGKMLKATTNLCHYCPKPAQQYHHWKGYEPEHWLDVVSVCTDCHLKFNRRIA